MATATTFRTHAAARPRIARRDDGRSRARVALVRATSDPSSASYDQVVDAIVIGGSSGMGKAAAREVVKRGGKVLIGSRSREKLDAAAADIASSLGLDPADAEARVPRRRRRQHRRDFRPKLFRHDVPGRVQRHGCQRCRALRPRRLPRPRRRGRPRLRRQQILGRVPLRQTRRAETLAGGGGVVLFSGVLSRRPGVQLLPARRVQRGAIEELVRSLALELGPRLRINCFSPGSSTPNGSITCRRNDAKRCSRSTRRRFRSSGSVPRKTRDSRCILMQSAYTTGAILDCDGGHQVRQYATREETRCAPSRT